MGTGGVQVGGAGLTVSEAYAVEDKITDAIDQSGLGFVRINAGNVYVTPNSFLSPAADDTGALQRAIDVASSGDTVNVEAGTYPGLITVGKALTISGAGSGVSGSVVTYNNAMGNGFTIAANNITVEGLRIVGNNSPAGLGFTLIPRWPTRICRMWFRPGLRVRSRCTMRRSLPT